MWAAHQDGGLGLGALAPSRGYSFAAFSGCLGSRLLGGALLACSLLRAASFGLLAFLLLERLLVTLSVK